MQDRKAQDDSNEIQVIEKERKFEVVYYDPNKLQSCALLPARGNFKSFIQDTYPTKVLILEHQSKDGSRKPNGYGFRLVAGEDCIEKGARICDYLGDEDTLDKILKKNSIEDKDKHPQLKRILDYVLFYTPNSRSKKGVFAHDSRSAGGFANGQLTRPNAVLEVKKNDKGKMEAYLEATETIRPYEEVALDYGDDYHYDEKTHYIHTISIDNWPNPSVFFKKNGLYYSTNPIKLTQKQKEALRTRCDDFLIPNFLEIILNNQEQEIPSKLLKKLVQFPLVELNAYNKKEVGIDVDIEENQLNISALIFACAIQNVNAIKKLLALGVDPFVKTMKNDNVFSVLLNVSASEDEFITFSKPILQKIGDKPINPLLLTTSEGDFHKGIISVLKKKQWFSAQKMILRLIKCEMTIPLTSKPIYHKKEEEITTKKRKPTSCQLKASSKKNRVSFTEEKSNLVTPHEIERKEEATEVLTGFAQSESEEQKLYGSVDYDKIETPEIQIARIAAAGLLQLSNQSQEKKVSQLTGNDALFCLYNALKFNIIKAGSSLFPTKTLKNMGFKTNNVGFKKLYRQLGRLCNFSDESTYEKIKYNIINKKLEDNDFNGMGLYNVIYARNIFSWFIIPETVYKEHNQNLIENYIATHEITPVAISKNSTSIQSDFPSDFSSPSLQQSRKSVAYDQIETVGLEPMEVLQSSSQFYEKRVSLGVFDDAAVTSKRSYGKRQLRGTDALFYLYNEFKPQLLSAGTSILPSKNVITGFKTKTSDFNAMYPVLSHTCHFTKQSTYAEIRNKILNRKLEKEDFQCMFLSNTTRVRNILSWFIIGSLHGEHNTILIKEYIQTHEIKPAHNPKAKSGDAQNLKQVQLTQMLLKPVRSPQSALNPIQQAEMLSMQSGVQPLLSLSQEREVPLSTAVEVMPSESTPSNDKPLRGKDALFYLYNTLRPQLLTEASSLFPSSYEIKGFQSQTDEFNRMYNMLSDICNFSNQSEQEEILFSILNTRLERADLQKMPLSNKKRARNILPWFIIGILHGETNKNLIEEYMQTREIKPVYMSNQSQDEIKPIYNQSIQDFYPPEFFSSSPSGQAWQSAKTIEQLSELYQGVFSATSEASLQGIIPTPLESLLQQILPIPLGVSSQWIIPTPPEADITTQGSFQSLQPPPEADITTQKSFQSLQRTFNLFQPLPDVGNLRESPPVSPQQEIPIELPPAVPVTRKLD